MKLLQIKVHQHLLPMLMHYKTDLNLNLLQQLKEIQQEGMHLSKDMA